jgi:beta-glucanase (GH16 family)
MSFIFGFKYRFGLVPSAKKIDSDWDKVFSTRDRLLVLQDSEELKRFDELDTLIRTNEFQKKKHEIESLRFSGSKEESQLKEYSSLEKLKSIKKYFKAHSSEQLARFNRILDSEKLSQYNELERLICSIEYKSRRREIDGLSFKTSPEYSIRKQFIALKKNKSLKRYNKTLLSVKYKLFLEVEEEINKNPDNSDVIEKSKMKVYKSFLKSRGFENLKAVANQKLPEKLESIELEVNSREFLEREGYLKDKNRYKLSDDYRSLIEYNLLRKDPEIKFWMKYFASAGYKNYKEVDGSKNLERYYQLKEIVFGDEFKIGVEYLKNKNRYKESEEYQTEKEFEALDKGNILQEYRRLRKSKETEFFKKWEIVFEEEFSEDKLKSDKWLLHDFWGNRNFGESFSQANDLQCYNGEKNIDIHNGVLSILTRKEQAEGKVWNPILGMAPRTFEYTSGLINTGESFRIKEGVIESKIRFNAMSALTNAFSLKGDNAFPQIDILRSGKRSVRVGVINNNGKGIKAESRKLISLNLRKFHVYRLELTKNMLVWKINGTVVFKRHLSEPMPGMYLNFLTTVHKEIRGKHTHEQRMEIDWIRCLKVVSDQ